MMLATKVRSKHDVFITGGDIDTSTLTKEPPCPTDEEMAKMVSTYLKCNATFDVNFDPTTRRYTIRLIDKTGHTLLGYIVDYTDMHGRK